MRARALASFAIVLVTSGCGGREAPQPDVILFTIDTLRADRVGARRDGPSPTPLADRWADEGVLFERCFAPRGQTHPSLASLLTGKYPITHGLRANGQDLASMHVPLPVVLRQAGYRTAAFCSNLDRTRWDFWVRGFDVAEDGVEGNMQAEGAARKFEFQAVWDDRVVAKAIRFVETLPDDGRPLFLWVHLFDPHEPYTPDAEHARLFVDPAYDGPAREPTGPPGGTPSDRISPQIRAWTLGAAPLTRADVAQVRALYDASVLRCDELLARVEDALRGKGRLANALRVYTADHGEELADHHAYFGHGNSIYGSTLRVPLVVAPTGDWHRGFTLARRTDALAQNLDLFPTVLALLDLEPQPGCEGFDLTPVLDGRGGSGRTRVFAEWEDAIYAVSDGRWTYVHNPGGVQPANPPYDSAPGTGFPLRCHELYDLATDPLEQRDVYAADHPEARRLARDLEEFLALPSHRLPLAPMGGADPALLEMGYASGGTGRVRIDCGDHR